MIALRIEGVMMSYEIIFDDMIDSLRMAQLKIYEYNIINEKNNLVKKHYGK